MDSIRKATTERDGTREELKEMTASRASLFKDKETFATQMKDRVN